MAHNKATIDQAIELFAKGEMVIITDNQDRENEGDLVLMAEKVTPQAINFMASHAKGLICLTVSKALSLRLGISPMVPVEENKSNHATQFMVSIEAREGVTTGISAHDRAHTIKVATAPSSSPDDLVSPGHVFPLMAHDGGVLVRAGHTEAGCDLAHMAGATEPAAVICEILHEDGTMARGPSLEQFSHKHNLKILTIRQIIERRLALGKTVKKISQEPIECPFGAFNLLKYYDLNSQSTHLALVKGTIPASDSKEATLVRVHVASFTDDCLFLGQKSSDMKGGTLYRSLHALQNHPGPSVLIVVFEPSASGYNRANTSSKQDTERHIGIGSQILRDIGVSTMDVLGAKKNYLGLEAFQLSIRNYINF